MIKIKKHASFPFHALMASSEDTSRVSVALLFIIVFCHVRQQVFHGRIIDAF